MKVGKSSPTVPGTRAQQKKKRHPRNKSYKKKKTINTRMIIIRFPRWGRVQMTQAERTCTTKYIPGTYLLRVADGYMFLRICILFQEDTEVLKKLFLMV